MSARLELIALTDFPLVEPQDDLAAQIVASLHRAALVIQEGDVVVVAQKIVSKSEDRYAYLNQVSPSEEAQRLALEIDKDPRLTQLILDESVEIVRRRAGVVIVEHRLGYVHANAGIDQSNITSDEQHPRVLLLPEEPDASAQLLRQAIKDKQGVNVAVIINDSAGRAWRNGTVGFAIGTAGFEPVVDLVGQTDIFGRNMQVTEVAVADELAAAASFLMGQADEATPVVLIRGARLPAVTTTSNSLIRSRDKDLFR